jgi:aconitase B
MPYTGTGVVSFGFPIDAFTFTYYISGLADDAAVAAAVGKAVSQDTTAASTVKLAADNDLIFGRVFQAENRSVLGVKTAAIQRRFKEKLPATAGHGIVVGNSVVGAGGGLVKVAGAANDTRVVEVGTDFVVVELL